MGKKIRPVTAGHIPGNINEPKKRKEKKTTKDKIKNVRKGRGHG